MESGLYAITMYPQKMVEPHLVARFPLMPSVSLIWKERLIFEAMAGAYPHDVQYTEDGGMAVVISDDYLTALDFSTGEPIPRRIAIADDLINPPKAEEVLLDPEGRYAIVHQYGVNDLVLVDFAEDSTAQVSLIEVGANPTDMDVSPSGEEAIVVARGSNELWIYDLENPTLAPSVIPMPKKRSLVLY